MARINSASAAGWGKSSLGKGPVHAGEAMIQGKGAQLVDIVDEIKQASLGVVMTVFQPGSKARAKEFKSATSLFRSKLYFFAASSSVSKRAWQRRQTPAWDS